MSLSSALNISTRRGEPDASTIDAARRVARSESSISRSGCSRPPTERLHRGARRARWQGRRILADNSRVNFYTTRYPRPQSQLDTRGTRGSKPAVLRLRDHRAVAMIGSQVPIMELCALRRAWARAGMGLGVGLGASFGCSTFIAASAREHVRPSEQIVGPCTAALCSSHPGGLCLVHHLLVRR